MPTRCRSWRFVGAEIPESRHLPVGRDHDVWRPCRNPVSDGELRCPECLRSLLTSPNPTIRAALAADPAISGDTLIALSTDGDAVVAATARSRIEARGGIEAVRSARWGRALPHAERGPSAQTTAPTPSPWDA